MQENGGMKIWEPAKGYLYDTDSNMNFVDMTQPYEVYASPVFPHLSRGRHANPVRHFRKVYLFQNCPGILDYFQVKDGVVSLRKHKGSIEERHEDFQKKMRHIIDTYASKDRIKKYMYEISSYQVPMTQSDFYRKVYRRVRKSIRRDRVKLFRKREA